jgi:hypothetical protein
MTASVASPTTEPLAITDAAFRKAATRKAATTTNSGTGTGTGTGDLTSTIVDPKACDSKTGSAASTAKAGSALDDNRKNRPTHWHPAVPTTGAPAAAVATRAEPSPC